MISSSSELVTATLRHARQLTGCSFAAWRLGAARPGTVDADSGWTTTGSVRGSSVLLSQTQADCLMGGGTEGGFTVRVLPVAQDASVLAAALHPLRADKGCVLLLADESARDWSIEDRASAAASAAQIDERLRSVDVVQSLHSAFQHRMSNAIATIRAICRRTAETSVDVGGFAMHLEGRIEAVGRAQALISRRVDGDVDLHSLLVDEMAAVLAREGEDYTLNGPDVAVPSRMAASLALGIHELATNALKFGALADPGGQIDISWAVLDGDEQRLSLHWTERTTVTLNSARVAGFGLELLEQAMPYNIGAEVEVSIDRDGLSCRIVIPLSPDAR